MNKVTRTTPREQASPQNGMPEPVPYVYRQQSRRNDWAARIARRNAGGWSQPPAVSAPEETGNVHRRPLMGIMRTLDSFTPRRLAGCALLKDGAARQVAAMPPFGTAGSDLDSTVTLH
jgi:hypothetical protein